MAKYDVFISYSRHDHKIVSEVVKRLRIDGFSVWMDLTGIESGDAFKKIIANAIDHSKCLVFFSSKHSNLSEWTAKEIALALYDNKAVIPVKIDDTKYNIELRLDLINLDYIDLTKVKYFEENIARLKKSLIAKGCKPLDAEFPATIAPQSGKFKHPINSKLVTVILCSVALLGLCGFLKRFYSSTHDSENPKIVEQMIPVIPVDDTLKIVDLRSDPRFHDVAWLSERLVGLDDVRDLTPSQCRLLRNCIFAKHGLRFSSIDLQAFFGQYDWYSPVTNEISATSLSEIEMANVKFLKEYENSDK